MQSQDNVIIIKDDDDEEEQECNKSTAFLRMQRFCQKTSGRCRQYCSACHKHGSEDLKADHSEITIEMFSKYFQKLEESCSKQTEHYIRQMNYTELNAIKAIRKKKQEYFKEIEEIKMHLMKKTYADLEEKYPHLYQKCKNDRLDTLKCCQVFWVINTPPNHHSIKHSQINKKLQAILKKFQAFKEVSRNINKDNLFNIKQQVKKLKKDQKSTIPVPTQPEGIRSLERVNYSTEQEERYRRQIDKQSRQLMQLKQKRRQCEQDVMKLMRKSQQLIRKELQKQNKLKLQSHTVQIFTLKFNQEDQQLHQMREQHQQISVEPFRPAQLAINQHNSQELQNQQVNQIIQQPPQSSNDIQQNIFTNQPNKNNVPAQSFSLQLVFPPPSENQTQIKGPNHFQPQNQSINAIKPEKLAQSEQPPRPQQYNPPPPSLLKPQVQSEKSYSLQQVKEEPNQEAFVPWKNTELLQQMRKFGKKIEHGLKIEDIDVLSTLDFITPPPSYQPFRFTSPKRDQPQKKYNNYNAIAQKCFNQQQRKKSNQKDKSQ